MKHLLELTVLMYHYVRNRGDIADAGSGIPGMSIEGFEAQLGELSHKHTFVGWPAVRAALRGNRPVPNSACLLTFDDGVRDHYVNVFRILRDRGLSGLFFVLARDERQGLILAHKIHFLLASLGLAALRDAIWEKLNSAQRERFTQAEQRYQLKYPPVSEEGRTNLLKAVLQRDLSPEADALLRDLFEEHVGPEKEAAQNYYLSLEQIREMAAGGMHFGGHSHSHPWFDWIDSGNRTAEITASAAWLRQIEPGPWAFAYPYGGFSKDAPQLLKAHGFVAAFTTKAQAYHSDPYLIGRLDGEELAQEGQGYV
jgi:peptidoglycan/xylan/chitin deacetylase (PgdA/CDA1 family)